MSAAIKYASLRDFLKALEARGKLKRIHQEIDPCLEITEICYRTLRAGGPALLFNNPKGSSIPVLGNLFGTTERVAMGMGATSVEALRETGRMLAFLKAPELPEGLGDMLDKLPAFRRLRDLNPRVLQRLP